MTAEIFLRPADPLDVPEARRVVNEVRALPPGTRVQVDVSALREVHPAGLAYLAYALARNREVALRGLNRRHERLLAYLLAEHVMRAATPAGATPEPSSSAAS